MEEVEGVDLVVVVEVEDGGEVVVATIHTSEVNMVAKVSWKFQCNKSCCNIII